MAFFWQNPTVVAKGPSGRKIKYHVQVRAGQWEWSVSRDTGKGTKTVFGISETKSAAIEAANKRVGTF